MRFVCRDLPWPCRACCKGCQCLSGRSRRQIQINALDYATGIMHYYLVAHGQRLHQEVEATTGRAKAGAEMAC
eukprot:1145807-Pelagomonas_calceolata.AAC.1